MGITIRSVIRIAYKTPIQNRHSEAPVAPLLTQNRHSETVDRALVSRNSISGPKFTAERPTISPIPRFSGSSASLDDANRWRAQHTESPYHGDRKSCSTQLEISTRAKELGITFRLGIGISDVTTIQNRHSETVDKALVSRNSIPGPKFATERVY
ncbi:hypothetical protein Taro_051499 [Colocasia esculenta]|uniref:Uncharacterized protein n=1 Tax=Colocasia esculenta TaxID=4460 RepID=A0A843XHE7_COLES|nr:hypothetical protein [Colocasia esculenta]